MFRNKARLKSANSLYYDRSDSYDVPSRLATARQNCNVLINYKMTKLEEVKVKKKIGTSCHSSAEPIGNSGIFIDDTDDEESNSEDDDGLGFDFEFEDEIEHVNIFTFFKMFYTSMKTGLRNIRNLLFVFVGKNLRRVHDLDALERGQSLVELQSEQLEIKNKDSSQEIDSLLLEEQLFKEGRLIPVKLVVPGQGLMSRYGIKTADDGPILDVTEIGIETRPRGKMAAEVYLSGFQELTSMIINSQCATIMWIFCGSTRIALITESRQPDAWTPQQYYRKVLSSMALVDSIMIGHPYFWHPPLKRRLDRAVRQFKKLYRTIDQRKARAEQQEARRQLRKEAAQLAMKDNNITYVEKANQYSKSHRWFQRGIRYGEFTNRKHDDGAGADENENETQVIMSMTKRSELDREKRVKELLRNWNSSKWATNDNDEESRTSSLNSAGTSQKLMKSVAMDLYENSFKSPNSRKRSRTTRDKSLPVKFNNVEPRARGLLSQRKDEVDDDYQCTSGKTEFLKPYQSVSRKPGRTHLHRSTFPEMGITKEEFSDSFTRLPPAQSTSKSRGKISHANRIYEIPEKSNFLSTLETSTNYNYLANKTRRPKYRQSDCIDFRNMSDPDKLANSSGIEPSDASSTSRSKRSKDRLNLAKKASDARRNESRDHFNSHKFGLSKYQPAIPFLNDESSFAPEADLAIGPPLVTFNEPLVFQQFNPGPVVELAGAVGNHLPHHQLGGDHQHHHGHGYLDIPPADAETSSPLKSKSLSEEDLSGMVTKLDLETSTYPSNLGFFSHYGVQHHHHGEPPPRSVSNLHQSSRSNYSLCETSSNIKSLDLSSTPAGPNGSSSSHHRPGSNTNSTNANSKKQ